MTAVKPEELYLARLPAATRRAFLFCTSLPMFAQQSWYLAGGTALALQVGHRESVDLDYFTPLADINTEKIEQELSGTGTWTTSLREPNTLYGTLQRAKLSCIAYPFFRPKKFIRCGTVRILHAEDIAAMKIVALSQRGRKRDFVDLYWYVKNRESLPLVIMRAMRQYPGQAHNAPHIFKSLTYFADAESDPMPHLFFRVSWEEIKAYFRREVPKATRAFLGLR